jgi:hypothetical protein
MAVVEYLFNFKVLCSTSSTAGSAACAAPYSETGLRAFLEKRHRQSAFNAPFPRWDFSTYYGLILLKIQLPLILHRLFLDLNNRSPHCTSTYHLNKIAQCDLLLLHHANSMLFWTSNIGAAGSVWRTPQSHRGNRWLHDRLNRARPSLCSHYILLSFFFTG